jgi:hypothetical protein
LPPCLPDMMEIWTVIDCAVSTTSTPELISCTRNIKVSVRRRTPIGPHGYGTTKKHKNSRIRSLSRTLFRCLDENYREGTNPFKRAIKTENAAHCTNFSRLLAIDLSRRTAPSAYFFLASFLGSSFFGAAAAGFSADVTNIVNTLISQLVIMRTNLLPLSAIVMSENEVYDWNV